MTTLQFNIMKIQLTLCALIITVTFSYAQDFGTMSDSRDGKSYKTVTYMDKSSDTPIAWLAENLNYEMTGAYAYDTNPKNAKKMGLLYTQESAMNACPDGWHLATDEEWESLVVLWGGSKVAGKALKSTDGWSNDANGTNISGFNALPAGGRNLDGTFDLIGSDGTFWTSTKGMNESLFEMRQVYDYGSGVYNGMIDKEAGYACRCVKD